MHVHCMNCDTIGDYPDGAQCQNDIMDALPDWQVSGTDWFCPNCLHEQMSGSAVAHGTKLIPDLDEYIGALDELVGTKKIDERVLEQAMKFKAQLEIVIEHLKNKK